ncbi:hypothetical protein Tco_0832202 [Tanacetum coccineum]
MARLNDTTLVDMHDMWSWSLDGTGEYFVASVRKMIDDSYLPSVSSKTRWINVFPIKIDIHAWKVKLDCLPTRLNISRRVQGSSTKPFTLSTAISSSLRKMTCQN